MAEQVVYDAGVAESAPDVVELALIGKTSPLQLFEDRGLDPIIGKIRDEVKKHVADISTERGRKAIASLSRKVASSKVRLDDLGKELVSELKAQTTAIDAERKRMRDELDSLRDETRKPLTDWEEAEKSRVQSHEDALKTIADLANVPFGASVGDLTDRLATVNTISERDWQEFAARFKTTSESVVFFLSKLIAETKAQAEQQAELKRLQEAETVRLQAERDARIQAEAAAKAKADAEAKAAQAAKAEEERQFQAAALAKQETEARIKQIEEAAAKEKAEAEFMAKKKQDAADKARKDAEERTRLAEEAVEKAKADAELATERERERVAAEAAKVAAETAARENDKKHKAAINSAAVAAIALNCYLTEENAKLVVIAIAQGKIPAVKIAY